MYIIYNTTLHANKNTNAHAAATIRTTAKSIQSSHRAQGDMPTSCKLQVAATASTTTAGYVCISTTSTGIGDIADLEPCHVNVG